MQPKLKIDTREFNLALRQYMQHTSRDLAYVINKKASSIVTKAYRKTKIADVGDIDASLSQRINGKPVLLLMAIKRAQMKLAAKQEKAAAAGKKSRSVLRRAQILSEMRKIRGARVRARMFMKAGWLDPMRIFGQAIRSAYWAGSKSKFRQADMGGGDPAKPGWHPKAEFWNAALAKRTKNQSNLIRYAGKALKEAITEEVLSMRQYIESKLQATANRYGKRR